MFQVIIFTHILAKSQKTPRKKWTEKQIQSLHSGYELYEALTCASDPASFEVSEISLKNLWILCTLSRIVSINEKIKCTKQEQNIEDTLKRGIE